MSNEDNTIEEMFSNFVKTIYEEGKKEGYNQALKEAMRNMCNQCDLQNKDKSCGWCKGRCDDFVCVKSLMKEAGK
jgi:hypothetical protein